LLGKKFDSLCHGAVAITSHDAPCPNGFKPEWRDTLERKVAIYRRLPEDFTAELEEHMVWFIGKVEWEWHSGIIQKEEHKVCMAAEACVLILRRSREDYSRFRTVEFFSKDLAPVGKPDAAGDAGGERVRAGWYWTEEGMEDGVDNYNLAIHEFAHIIDQKHGGYANAVPKLSDFRLEKEWKRFAKREFADLCNRWERKSGTRVIREYGATNMAEFFACGTVAFFERSEELKLCRPRLYEWFEKIYGYDPAPWPDRVTQADLHTARRLGQPVVEDHERVHREQQKRREGRQRERLRQEREKARLDAAERAEREEAERTQKEEERRRKEEERRARLRWLTLNRAVTVFHPSGIPHLKYTLVDGKRDGVMQRWDEQGNLREETEYAKDKKHGKGVYYYPSGKKEIEGFFSMGKRASVWRGWHEDGTLKYRSEYRDGELKGWKNFLEDGETETFGSEGNRFGRR